MPKNLPYVPGDASPSLTSRIRGLLLGLALGDAIGSQASDIPAGGPLEAGAATQLAAWTVEGTLREMTRYGQWSSGEVCRYAYQRWATLRDIKPMNSENWAPFFWPPEDRDEHALTRGWLVDVPAMAAARGTSPSTEKALRTGNPVQSAGCQAMLRVLPIAAIAFQRRTYSGETNAPGVMRDASEQFARRLAGMTHDDGDRQNTTALAIQILIEALMATDDLKWSVKRAAYDAEYAAAPKVMAAFIAAGDEPCVPQVLERLAPDKTSWSALVGGVYVALSFPEEDTVAEAIEFAGWAPDGDSVGAVAGAILGARHGFEALPAKWANRLELGWVMDRLAIDLSAEVMEHQGGTAWKDDYGELRPVDPWWGLKYPGV